MGKLKKAISRHSIANSSADDSLDIEQFGRSSSGLRAEQAAASLREGEAKSSDKSASTPNLLDRRSSSDSQSSDSESVVSPLPSAQQQNPSSDSLTSPQPLDAKPTSSSNNEVIDTEQEDRSSGDSTRPLPPLTKADVVPSSRRGPASRPSLFPTKIRSTPELAGQKARSTLTLKDLGSDYTRYFSPFPNSARSSFIENPSTPLPNYPSSPRTTTPLAAVHPTNPFLTPNASTTKLLADYDPEKNGSLVDDRLGAPYDEKGSLGWPLIGDKEEDDDEMHMPHPDDDIKYKVKFKDHFTRASIASTIGLFLMLIGLLVLFVGLPVMSYFGIIKYNSAFETPLSKMPKFYPPAETWATVNNKTYPLLQNIRRGLIDPDTPKSAMTKKGEYGDEYELVFSDEFNDNNRTFYEGDDPYFFAPDIWYGATQDLEWYDPDAVTTWDGTLELRLDKFLNHGLPYRSGMLNSWNQLCFKGGIFEVSMSLPGPAGTPGLWPGVWTMGNLGRPGYLSTTDGMWPYTYQACDVGITPNQSSYDGHSRLPGQRLPSCTCKSEDHPTPGTGRGAPEIDIVEAGAAYGASKMPIATQSYQVAPFDIWYYPDYEYTTFPDYSLSYTNGYTGGPFQQAISATTNLNRNWFDGKEYQRYSFEYVPGEGEGSYIVWKVGGQTMFTVDGRAIRANGNIQARQISEEPMSMVLNLGISNSWTWIDWDHLVFPTVMRVDYVRWYQKKGEHMVTCDPPGFETTGYIKDHINAYTNPNFTKWDQTGHAWPKHKLNSDC